VRGGHCGGGGDADDVAAAAYDDVDDDDDDSPAAHCIFCSSALYRVKAAIFSWGIRVTHNEDTGVGVTHHEYTARAQQETCMLYCYGSRATRNI
jgi:hypothetical protein